MKKIYACKQSKFHKFALYLLMVLLIGSLITNIILLTSKPADEKSSYPLWLNIISNVLVFFSIFYSAFYRCNKSFVEFDDDKIIFQTQKNKRTEIPYKDIDSHEIHIFEIVFHLKNGQKKVLNLDTFTYENIRKIKETLLQKLG